MAPCPRLLICQMEMIVMLVLATEQVIPQVTCRPCNRKCLCKGQGETELLLMSQLLLSLRMSLLFRGYVGCYCFFDHRTLEQQEILVRRGNAGGFAQCRFIPTAEEMALGFYCVDGEGMS